MSVFEELNEDITRKFRKAFIKGKHNLHERPAFSREGLIEFLDRIDPENMSIFTHRESGNHVAFSLVDRANLGGEDLFKAIETGSIWVNLHRIQRVGQDYADITDEIEASLEVIHPNLRARQWHHKILISSPGILVPYHVDPMENLLWHISGPKQFYNYPGTAEFAGAEAIEAILLQQQDEDVPYDPAYEASASVHDLLPGEFISWPQYTPHRVANGDGVNVSVTTEFFTPESQVRSGAMFFNGLARKYLKTNPGRVSRVGFAERAKWVAAKALRSVKAHRPVVQEMPQEFRLDLSAPNCLHKIA